jgi:hypothetical protein
MAMLNNQMVDIFSQFSIFFLYLPTVAKACLPAPGLPHADGALASAAAAAVAHPATGGAGRSSGHLMVCILVYIIYIAI